ncbi:MAG: hypothetical protein WAZ18_06040 [Alphaproteobacteria bacterium]
MKTLRTASHVALGGLNTLTAGTALVGAMAWWEQPKVAVPPVPVPVATPKPHNPLPVVKVLYNAGVNKQQMDPRLELFIQATATRCGGRTAWVTSLHRTNPTTGPDGKMALNSYHMKHEVVVKEGKPTSVSMAADFVVPGCSHTSQNTAAVEVWQRWKDMGGMFCYDPTYTLPRPNVHIDMGPRRTKGCGMPPVWRQVAGR